MSNKADLEQVMQATFDQYQKIRKDKAHHFPKNIHAVDNKALVAKLAADLQTISKEFATSIKDIAARIKSEDVADADATAVESVQTLLNQWLEAYGKAPAPVQSHFATTAPQIKDNKLKVGGLFDALKNLFKKKKETPAPAPAPVAPTPAPQHDVIDLRNAHKGNAQYQFHEIAAHLFEKGNVDALDIDPNDVQQGQIGDCYFMSAISAVAQANPEAIRKLIKDNGDGTYDVTLYAKKDKLSLTPQVVKIRPEFPTNPDGSPLYADMGDKELWVMILEKAYAKLNGGYDDIGEGGYIETGIESLTGQEASYYMCSQYSETELLDMIKAALAAKKPITAATEGSGEVEFKTEAGQTVYKGHAYSVKSVSGDKIDLRNPWGHSHATLTIKEFKKYYNHIAY